MPTGGDRSRGFGRNDLVAWPEFGAAVPPASSYWDGGLPATELRPFG